MGHSNLSVRISAPFGPCNVKALVEYAGGSTTIAIENGRFVGSVPAKPERLRCLDEEFIAASADATPEPPTGGTPVDVDQLFGAGVSIPENGDLDLLVVWGTPCHQTIELPEGERFGSFEHQICAERVGLDANGERYTIDGAVMPLEKDDLLPAGNSRLTFGAIISLAGDYYAHLDATAATQFSWAWPELRGFVGWLTGRDYRTPTLISDEAEDTKDVLDIIARDKDVDHGVAGEFCALVKDSVAGNYPARRYLALASQNYCHFGSPDGTKDHPGNLALRLYREYHARALAEAARAGTDNQALARAFVIDAFGCHFLTDLFASGHMRVPRKRLSEKYGILIGALRKSHAMHAEDNSKGLLVAARGSSDSPRRMVWRAFGDGMLRSDKARTHLAQVQEAVRRSAAEVFAKSRDVTFAAEDRAEWMIPVPLSPGETPRAADNVLCSAELSTPNHYPLYWLAADGSIHNRA